MRGPREDGIVGANIRPETWLARTAPARFGGQSPPGRLLLQIRGWLSMVELQQEAVTRQRCPAAWHAKPSVNRPPPPQLFLSLCHRQTLHSPLPRLVLVICACAALSLLPTSENSKTASFYTKFMISSVMLPLSPVISSYYN